MLERDPLLQETTTASTLSVSGVLFGYIPNYVSMHHGLIHYRRPLGGPLVNQPMARKMLSSFLPFAKEKAPTPVFEH